MRQQSRMGFVAAILLVAALALTGCGAVVDKDANIDGYVDITVEELRALMAEQEVTLVNVHIPYAGDLPGTDLSIPYNEIGQYVDQLPGKNQPVVLYCRSGSMSTTAARELAAAGYRQIYELDGGMVEWVRSGYELVSE